jgi:hypothetical protein
VAFWWCNQAALTALGAEAEPGVGVKHPQDYSYPSFRSKHLQCTRSSTVYRASALSFSSARLLISPAGSTISSSLRCSEGLKSQNNQDEEPFTRIHHVASHQCVFHLLLRCHRYVSSPVNSLPERNCVWQLAHQILFFKII